MTKTTSGRLSSAIQALRVSRGSRLVLALAVRGPSPGERFAETLAGECLVRTPSRVSV